MVSRTGSNPAPGTTAEQGKRAKARRCVGGQPDLPVGGHQQVPTDGQFVTESDGWRSRFPRVCTA